MHRENRCPISLSLLTCSLMASACASGEGISRGDASATTDITTSEAGSTSSGGEPEPDAPDAPDEPGETTAGQLDDCAVLAPQVEAILETNCASCHGTSAPPEGGMDYVTSLASLVAKKKVIPGASAESPLFARLDTQSMPPPGVLPRPSLDEVEVIRQWIDAGACVTSPPTDCADNGVITRDEMADAMSDDIQDFDLEDRPFMRYLTLTHLHNAGTCDAEIEPYRQALSKLFNSLSHETLIALPAPIDPERTIFRVDLRDYGWDTASELLGEDLWDATVAANPYALVLQGGRVEDLKSSANTPVPFQPADSFLHIVTRAPLYNKILLLPATIAELEQTLGVDVLDNLADEEVQRAGFKDSGVSEFNRIIERHIIPAGGNRYYYLSHDFNSSSGASDIFANPLDFVPAGGEYIFSLPNGTQGYAISDAAGNIIDEAPVAVVSDPKQRDRTVRTAISCISCHDRGILPKADEIGPFVKDNLVQFPDVFVRETVEALHDPKLFAQQLFDAGIFAGVMSSAGVPPDAPEPIVFTYLSFEADLDLRQVAAELGISAELLKKNLALLGDLDKSLVTLYDGGQITRESFSLVFKDIMCKLLVGDKVIPLCVIAG